MIMRRTSTLSTELLRALSEHHLFRQVAPERLRELSAQASVIQIQAGEHLFFVDDPAEAFYIVQDGEVYLYRPNYEGSEKVFHVVSTGGLIAETAMFAQPCRYPLSAQAQTPTRLYRIARQALVEFTRQSGEFALQLLANMSLRLHQAVNRIDHLTTSNASQRLVLYLIDLSREQGSRSIRFPLAGSTLAGQLNIAPETLSRQLSHFKRVGLLEGRNREWVLVDIERLYQSVGLPVPAQADIIAWHHGDRGGDLFGCCNLS